MNDDDSAGSASLPSVANEVDAAWLTRAFQAQGRNLVVERLEREVVIHGAGTKIRVQIVTDPPAALPSKLWVKGNWEAHRDAFARTGCCAREAIFYESLSASLGVRAPIGYLGMWNLQGDGLAVIEDLASRGATLWDCCDVQSVDSVASQLDNLAKLHGHYWEDEKLLRMPFIDVLIRTDNASADWPRANGAARIEAVLSGPRGKLIPKRIQNPHQIERTFWKMVDSLAALQIGCLTHGDPHPGNCFSDQDGTSGLYDWQTLARGPWGHDVAYLIVGALDPATRRQSERELLAHYLQALRANGVSNPPDINDAWTHYRRHIAYPLLIWLTNHTTHQSEENCCALSERLGIAAEDFDLFNLWKD